MRDDRYKLLGPTSRSEHAHPGWSQFARSLECSREGDHKRAKRPLGLAVQNILAEEHVHR